MTHTTATARRRANAGAKSRDDLEALVENSIRERLSHCSYRFYFNRVRWTFERGTLTLNGCVPTFYMKQMLQTLVRGVDHVQRIVNDVDVVSSSGLSSVRPK